MISSKMTLRYVEDRRTLLWAFFLFPLGPVLALWRPSVLPWLAPLLLYCSYLSGVLTHNHNHCGIFQQRWANLAYGAWLSIFYGFPIFSWIPSHNQNHHRFRDGDGDVTATARHAERDSLWAALTYPTASSRFQLPALAAFIRAAFRARSRQRTRIVLESSVLLLAHAALLLVALLRHGIGTGALVYFGALGLPAFLGTYWMMLTNYLQHVGCDAASKHDHSRNFVSPFFNWFVFDNGLHTVHHEHPGLHWSRYRELHQRCERQIAPDLNQGTLLGFALRRYVIRERGGKSPVAAAAPERSFSEAGRG
jgi:beta-carotene hydroxylase